MDDQPWGPGERWRAGLLAAALLGAVLYPLRQYRRPADQRVDGFPLSYYPMFSARRSRHVPVLCAIGVAQDGGRRYLPYGLLGPGGLNQVRRQLRRVVDEGRVEQHTAVLAARVGTERGFEDVERVEIVRAVVDLDDCLLTRRVQGEETVLASAEVPRTDPTAAPDGQDAPELPA